MSLIVECELHLLLLYRFVFFFFIIPRPTRPTRTDTLVPYTTLFRSHLVRQSSDSLDADRDLVAGQHRADARGGAGEHHVAGQQRGEGGDVGQHRSEENTSELQSLMRISYAGVCLKKKKALEQIKQL